MFRSGEEADGRGVLEGLGLAGRGVGVPGVLARDAADGVTDDGGLGRVWESGGAVGRADGGRGELDGCGPLGCRPVSEEGGDYGWRGAEGVVDVASLDAPGGEVPPVLGVGGAGVRGAGVAEGGCDAVAVGIRELVGASVADGDLRGHGRVFGRTNDDR